MAARVTAWLLAALLASVLFALPSVRADDGPAQKALEAARDLERAVNADPLAVADDYEPAVRRYREVAQRYPGSPQAMQALYSAGLLCQSRLERYEEAVAAYEQVIEQYPGAIEAEHALHQLRDTIVVLLKDPQRWQRELRRMTDALARSLPQQANADSRCNVLRALVMACDLAGDTAQARAYCEQLLAAAQGIPGQRVFAEDYLRRAQPTHEVTLIEHRSVRYTCEADSLTPEAVVEKRVGRALSVAATAPKGRDFVSFITITTRSRVDATVPKGLVRILGDGRTVALWEGRHKAEGRFAGGGGYAAEVVRKGKVRVRDVQIWRTVEIIAPRRQLVTVTVRAAHPVSVEALGSDDAPIDPDTVSPPKHFVTRRQAAWTYEPGTDEERAGSGNLDCSQGRAFTFEMDLPDHVKRMWPRVTVGWATGFPFVRPKPLDDAAPTARATGRIEDVDYVLESPMAFRVTARGTQERVAYLLAERTERE